MSRKASKRPDKTSTWTALAERRPFLEAGGRSSGNNLKLRGGTYYALLNVPRPLRDKVGRNELLMTLKTGNPREANARKWGALKALHDRLELLVSDNPERHAMAEALAWRGTLQAERGIVVPTGANNPDRTEERAHDALRARVEELADNISPGVAARFYAAAAGNAVFLRDHVEAFLAAQDHTTEQTRIYYRGCIAELLKRLGETATAADVTRSAAGDHVEFLKAHVKKKTITSKLSALGCYWDWMMTRGLIENNPMLNPWKGHKLKKAKRAGAEEEGARRMWTDAELAVVLDPAFNAGNREPFRSNIPVLARLGMMTGARIEDICLWRADMVERDEYGLWIANQKGKTLAAKRRVPVHPVIVPLVERLAANPDKDGYLLHDLPLTGKDKRRSSGMSKRFSIQLRKVITDEGVCFHSLRNTVLEHLEGAGVAPATAKVIVAHKRGDITYGRYSKGLLLDLQAAIKQLRYSDAVMKLIAAH